MNKVKTWHIFVAILMVVSVFFVVKAAFGDEGNQKLSREEQIRIMKECYRDTKNVLHMGSRSTEMAITFFYYRTGMIPIAQ